MYSTLDVIVSLISFFKTTKTWEGYCKSKAKSMLGSAGANPRLWVLHKHDIWLLVRSVAWIQSEHLRSEAQPDRNVLPRGDSAGGDINNTQGTRGSEPEEFSVGQPAASLMVVHSILWFISLLGSFSRLINWHGLTCCWLLLVG